MTTNIRSILVPVDFSPASEQSVDYACGLARRLGASIHLLHVVEGTMTGDLHWEPYSEETAAHFERLRQEGGARLAATAARIEGHRVRTTREVRGGNPATEIKKAALDYGADLIIMATHGRTGLSRALLGSVAEEVVRSAWCPTLVIREIHTHDAPDAHVAVPAASGVDIRAL
jgi:nucleotide-binding universal stress UspA family protein